MGRSDSKKWEGLTRKKGEVRLIKWEGLTQKNGRNDPKKWKGLTQKMKRSDSKKNGKDRPERKGRSDL